MAIPSNQLPTPSKSPWARSLLVLVLAMALSAMGCSTTNATIHGLQISVGFEIDYDLEVSPHLEVGYSYLTWYDFIGAGGGAGLTVTPLRPRASFFLEGLAYMSPLLGFPMAPYALGGELAFEDGKAAPGLRGGISSIAFMPPSACVPPLEGDWEGCPPGVWESSDEVFPDWLPRMDFRVSWFPTLDDEYVAYVLQFSGIIAYHTMAGTEP